MSNENVKRIVIAAIGLLFVAGASAEVWNWSQPLPSMPTVAQVPDPVVTPEVTAPPPAPVVANTPDPNANRQNQRNFTNGNNGNNGNNNRMQGQGQGQGGQNRQPMAQQAQPMRVPQPPGVQVQQQTDANGNPGAVNVQINGRSVTLRGANGRRGQAQGQSGRNGNQGNVANNDQPVDDGQAIPDGNGQDQNMGDVPQQ